MTGPSGGVTGTVQGESPGMVTVAASGTTGAEALATTGASSGQLAVLALLLIMAGAALASRRRRLHVG